MLESVLGVYHEEIYPLGARVFSLNTLKFYHAIYANSALIHKNSQNQKCAHTHCRPQVQQNAAVNAGRRAPAAATYDKYNM